jgi:hypothetical protein
MASLLVTFGRLMTAGGLVAGAPSRTAVSSTAASLPSELPTMRERATPAYVTFVVSLLRGLQRGLHPVE